MLGTPLITPDSHWLAVVSSMGARLWDLTAQDPVDASGDLLAQHSSSGCGSHIADITASRNSRWLTVSTCGCTELFDLRVKRPWSEPVMLTPGGSQVTISDNSRWMVTQSGINDCLWDLEAKDILASPKSLRENEKAVKCAAFAPDGSELFAVREDGTTARWDLAAATLETKATGFGTADDWREVTKIHFSPNGTLLVAEKADELQIWDCKRKTLCPGKDFSSVSAGLTTPSPQRGPHISQLVTQTSQDGRWMLAHYGNVACLYDLEKPASDCKLVISEPQKSCRPSSAPTTIGSWS